MNKPTLIKPHWSFWVIVGLALIWNVMGCVNYVMQMNPDFLVILPESHRAAIVERPTWAIAAFAIAVFGATIGCVLLLIRKSVALYVLGLSLTGMAGIFVYTLTSTWGTDGASLLISITTSLVFAIFLAWYASFVIKKNWII